MDIKPIETHYNGYRFRSRLEARWAVFFDAAGIKYEYEPEGYVLDDGTPYLPDFYLPELRAFVEIKRANLPDDERESAEEKCRLLSAGNLDDSVLLCAGDPVDMDIMIFCGAWAPEVKKVVPWEDSAFFVKGAVWLEFENGETVLCGGEIEKVSIVGGVKRDMQHNRKLPIVIYHPTSIVPSSLMLYERGDIDECCRKAREARFEYNENHESSVITRRAGNEWMKIGSMNLPTRDKMLDLVSGALNGHKMYEVLIIRFMRKAETAVNKGIISENPYKGISFAEHLLVKQNEIKESYKVLD